MIEKRLNASSLPDILFTTAIDRVPVLRLLPVLFCQLMVLQASGPWTADGTVSLESLDRIFQALSFEVDQLQYKELEKSFRGPRENSQQFLHSEQDQMDSSCEPQ